MTTSLFAGATPLLLFVAKATLVLISAYVATSLLRRSTAGERHLVWLAALVGVLALPLLTKIPALQIGVLPSGLATPARATTPVAAVIAPAVIAPAAALPEDPAAFVASTPVAPAAIAPAAPAMIGVPAPAVDDPIALPTANSSSLLQTLAIVWTGVALSLLGWLAFGALQVRRIVRGGTELTTADWTTPLCEVADRLDLEQPPRLVMTDRIEMAFACRAMSPTIVLPAAAEHWTDDRRRAVLFHELAHVKRHDLVAHTLGRIACALYWFHPLVWSAAKALRAESERACDDLVLSCGARPSDYAQHLLEMVTSVRVHGAPVMALPMARKKEFEGRMLAILDPAIRRNAPGRLQAATVIATLGALSLTIAAVSPAPAATTNAIPALAAADTDPSQAARHASRDSAKIARAEARATARGSNLDASIDASVDRAIGSSVGMGVGAGAGAIARDAASFGMGVAQATLNSMGISMNKSINQSISQSINQSIAGSSSMRAQSVDTARIALLAKILATDPDASVRRSAAWGLNDVSSPVARAALIRALGSDSDDQVREMAAWALGESPSSDGSRALATALLKDKDAHVRQTAAWALGEDDGHNATDALISALSDSDPQVRESAIWALGESDLHKAPASLINALSDNSSHVRETTAWTLGQIGDTAATRALVRAFERETDDNVKSTYLWALSEIGDVPTSVIDVAMKSSNADLRRHAVAMLSGNGGSWPMPRPRPRPRPNP